MSLRIGNRLFAPPAWAVLLTGVALAAFVGLGYWQLGRAREKQALFEAFMAAGEDTVDASDLPFEQLARYQRIRLHGSYDSTRQVLLDNMPNFQLGVLEVVRYNVRVVRDNLSRMRTTDRLDPSAEAAFTNLSNDPFKWWFPSAESKWKEALAKLETYNQNLASGKSHFYPRADNLI